MSRASEFGRGPARWLRLCALVIVVVLTGCASGSSDPRPSSSNRPSAVQPSLHDFDAHDGGIVQSGSTYYLYGTAYDCGFAFGVVGTKFCGISVYSSTDLLRWTSHGLAFALDAGWQSTCTPGGCFRPHVVYNRAAKKFVMWINVFTGTYRVLTSDSPLGPWQVVPGAGAVPLSGGDETVFVDRDGTGYLVITDLAGRKETTQTHELRVYKLDGAYEHVSNRFSQPPVGFVEAPMMWRHADTYYLGFSDPACPYCSGTGTSVVTSASPLGPWSAPFSITAQSCGGQPTAVSTLSVGDQTIDLYQSDLWTSGSKGELIRNQAAAAQAWSPLSYQPSGAVAMITCPD